MSGTRGGGMVRSWRVLLDAGPVAGLGDGQLLERFATRDGETAEAAFAALVARHGPMVRRVCRGVLANPNDADDAFQATFLVLARKARSIRQPGRLANWLYGTAHRTSRKLRADEARRRKHEAARAAMNVAEELSSAEETGAVLEEVARLPQFCRVAVILCDLEGLAQDEAAQRLGCSDRTLRRRLSRAHDLLRDRLTRQGLAPASALFALKSSPVPAILVDSTARAALKFAAGQSMAGLASTSTMLLAEAMIRVLTATKLKAIAVGIGLVIALGGGMSVVSALAIPPAQEPPQPRVATRAEVQGPSPREQYQALIKRHEDAMTVFNAAYNQAKNPNDGLEIVGRLFPKPDDHAPAFLDLAERDPDDPVAVEALIWIVDLSTKNGGELQSGVFARTIGRAMEILAADHASDRRLGPLCFQLINYPSPRRDRFLETIAERSPDRDVKGQASLAFGQYLQMKREFVEDYRRSGDSHKEANLLPMFREGYLAQLLAADSAILLRESDRQFARVMADFGDIPYVDRSGLRADDRSRETLADVARRQRPGTNIALRQQLEGLLKAHREAEKVASQASDAAGGRPGFDAYLAAAPKWADQGRKIWELGRDNPRHPAGFDALLWIVEHGYFSFHDAQEERAEAVAGAVDLLIRERLDDIAADLGRREVSRAFGSASNPMPGPALDRLPRALFEQARTRETRGRAGLLLARYFKNEAEFAERLPRLGPDRNWYPPSYLDQLKTTGRDAINARAEALLEQVIADHGDVLYLNGMVRTDETLATVAARDLDEIRHLAIGRVAPEITGTDVDGKSMTLSEFRGKVVVLDFSSHEHCGGCKLVYPDLRGLVDHHKTRPLAVLGINNNDRVKTLKELAAKKEVTWRCWWDGDDALHPGSITTRWNIRGYPTFIILDHRGVIRFKDIHPFDPTFASTIEGLVKEAEAAGR